MRLVRENFPEIYNLYINGNVVIDKVYTYDNKKTGTPPEKVMKDFKATGSVELRNQLVMHYLNLVNLAIYSMRSVLLSNIPFL